MALYTLYVQYAGRPPETKSFDKETIVLGRDVGDIALLDPQVSGRHAELRFQGGKLLFQDLGSTNGSFLPSGERVSGPVDLGIGQSIRLGQSVITVQHIDFPGAVQQSRTMFAGAGSAPPPVQPGGFAAPAGPPVPGAQQPVRPGMPPGPPGSSPSMGGPPRPGMPPQPGMGAPMGQPGAPPQPGFGSPPAQPGFGAPPPAQPGFGAPPAPQAQPGFGAPAPQAQPGFGAPPPQAQPGFGAPPPAAQAQPGFGGAPAGQQPGFGAPPPQQQHQQPGFGAPPPQQQQQGFGAPPQQPSPYGAPGQPGGGMPPGPGQQPGQQPYGQQQNYDQQANQAFGGVGGVEVSKEGAIKDVKAGIGLMLRCLIPNVILLAGGFIIPFIWPLTAMAAGHYMLRTHLGLPASIGGSIKACTSRLVDVYVAGLIAVWSYGWLGFHVVPVVFLEQHPHFQNNLRSWNLMKGSLGRFIVPWLIASVGGGIFISIFAVLSGIMASIVPFLGTLFYLLGVIAFSAIAFGLIYAIGIVAYFDNVKAVDGVADPMADAKTKMEAEDAGMGAPAPAPGQPALGAAPGYGQPAAQPGYPAQQPAGGGYPPQQQPGGYPPQQQPGGYPPPQQPGGYPPQQQPGGYPPQQQPGGYPPQQGYPPQGGGYPPQGGGGWGQQ